MICQCTKDIAMANILQGFYSMPELYNNTTGQTAEFGELTTETRTFTKDEKEWALTTFPDVVLVSFESRDEMNVSVTPGNSYINTSLALGEWLYKQYVSGNIPNANRTAEFLQAIAIEFPSLTNVKIGAILKTVSGDKNYIDWISFTLSDGSKVWNSKVWCSNKSMFQEYEGGEIIVLPPVEPIDGLQGTKASVTNLLRLVTPDTMIEKMNAVQGRYRATSTRSLQLTWHDPNDATSTLVTSWYIVVYGNAINDVDLIKNAIRDYLDSNSAHTNWRDIYPELYSSNEFVMIPLYDDIAFPGSVIDQGGYRSLTRIGDKNTIARQRIPNGYSQTANLETYMSDNLELLSHTYRTMFMLVLANPANAGGVFRLTTLYPDYRNLPSTSIDFNRMDPKTREFSIQLQYALDIAYNFRETDVAPNGYYKIKRGVRTYIGWVLHGYTYLILIRSNY